MTTKLDSPSTVESRYGQSTAPVLTSSTVSATSPKVSMFGTKAGFVIPKNKLSGSLVPIFRGGSKIDSGSISKEESTKQAQRKTKWGIDLSQDAIVRKGKALAYQTRVEQITQQLNGLREFEDDLASESPRASSTYTANDLVDCKPLKFEVLELERRELIGEILRLNPSYKAPSDYKPLLKESNVPIPIKSHPGYNFIGLLLGPESNTQKRLEEETGAKVRVYGTKSGLEEKHEITKSDIGVAQEMYADLYVNISADTFEKVDAAVALIELLLTPVSGNLGAATKVTSSLAGNETDIQTANQDSGFLPAPVNVVLQTGPWPSSLPIQPGQPPFQPFHTSWLPANFAPRPSSPFMPPVLSNNPIQFPALRVPSGMPHFFGHPHNVSFVPRASPHALRSHLYIQFPPRQSASVTISQPLTTIRPSGAMNPQIGPPVRAPVAPPANFSGWSPALNAPSRPSLNPMAPPSSNLTIRLPPPSVPSARPSSGPPQFEVSNNTARPPANFTPHSTPPFSARPSTAPPSFSPAPSQVQPSSTPRAASSSLGSPMPPPSPVPVPLLSSSPCPSLLMQIVPPASASLLPQIDPSASAPLMPPMLMPQPPALPTSNSLTLMPTFPPSTSIPIGASPASKPLRHITGDFTFQPLRTPPSSSPPNPPASRSSALQNPPQVPPFAAPKPPSFRPVLQNSMSLTTSASITSFPANASNIRPSPPVLQGYPSITPVHPVALAMPAGSPSFPRPPQAPNPTGPRPAYPTNFQQVHQNQLTRLTRPGGSFTVPNQQLDGKTIGSMPGNVSTSNQIYDPLSPTDSAAPPQRGPNAAAIKKPETDAEYEDLMASVGVM